ncbi:MAG: acido-empty-quinoprotein group A [Acidobacteriota bacterium]
MTGAKIFVLIALALPACAFSQTPDAAKPPVDAWPTYNGDYSGRRFSPLTLLDTGNVRNLSLAWSSRVASGAEGHGVRIAATPLMVDGILYFTSLDNVWAMDARSGREIWHYYRESKGDMPRTGNRGVGMYRNWLFFVTIDDYLVSLDAASGKQRWIVKISDAKQYFISTVAPVIVGNHVLIGSGGDSLGVTAFVEAHDPETGAVQWKWRTTPAKGEPGIETWPDEYAAAAGGGHPWISGTYDPELNLYYVGTGNPDPVHAGQGRQGDNLWTCSIVALNPDTGKMAWYQQVSPHDTHDWDAVQTPVLIDGVIDGQPRKLLAQANRNGYFFLLDRTNGKSLVTVPYLRTMNWSLGTDGRGQPIPNPAKEPSVDGVLVSPPTSGATNWPPPSFSPRTGLFYVSTNEAYSLFYLTDPDKRPQGFAGRESGLGGGKSALLAIDYQSGKVAWRHDWRTPSGPVGILTTAGNLLFTGTGNWFIAFDAVTGRTLWHAGLMSGLTNGPVTYLLDGRQYVVVGAGDALYAFVLNR